MSAGRLSWVDSARGLAILLVILGHAIQYTVPDFDRHLGFRLIYAFHMPLFMFISGFVTAPFAGPLGTYAARRARALLLPFFTWLPICYLSIRWLQRPAGFDPSFVHFLIDLLHSPDAGGLWFLVVLFECQLLLALASRLGGRHATAAAVAALLALNVLLTLAPALNWAGLGLLRWHFLFFLLGHVARRRGVQPPGRLATLLCFALFIGLAMFWSRKSAVPVELWGAALSATVRRFLTQGYHAVTALAGIAAVLGACRAADASARPLVQRLMQVLQTVGRQTLELYAAHYAFLYLAVALTVAAALGESARIGIVFAAAALGALGFARAARGLPPLQAWLFGR
jgi:fucose 4-O-acetylase-like acetyltransferase